MSNKKQQVKKRAEPIKFNKGTELVAKKWIAIGVGIAVILVAGIFVVKGNLSDGETAQGSGDLIIPKSEITQNVKFYPYSANGTKLEILAVKASDGTIRTAFNTCQVCNGSPKAYYKQVGDVLVCQNCGNQFKMDMVEKEKGGCNPVPIMEENKTDDGTNIRISMDYIEKNKNLFPANWKTK